MAEPMLAWLRATITGDKALAESIRVGLGEWRYDRTAYPGCPPEHALGVGDRVVVDVGFMDDDFVKPDEARHIATHDPRDVIARCEAELALLDKAEEAIKDAEGVGLWSQTEGEVHGRAGAYREAAEIIAGGYRHRPGYADAVGEQ